MTYHRGIKATQVEGKPTLEQFTQTMKALSRVPKSALEERREPSEPEQVQKPHP